MRIKSYFICVFVPSNLKNRAGLLVGYASLRFLLKAFLKHWSVGGNGALFTSCARL